MFDEVDYFTDESLLEDPFPYFDHLRAQCPVKALPHHGVVAITGYDEAAEAWRDHATFSACNSVTGPFPGVPPCPEGVDIRDHIEQHRSALPLGEYLATQDQPTHTALRGLLMRLLTPRRLQENEEFIWRLVDRELDRVLPAGRFEVVGGYGKPVATLVIADLLGVPEADHTDFARRLGIERPDPGFGDSAGGEHTSSLDPLAFLFETFSAYIEDRRRAPRQDVLTHLATATYPDGSTPDIADVVRTATFLFAAGQDTTARLVAATTKLLGDDPALQAAVRADLGCIPDLLEEVLRLDGPVKTVSRLATRDTTLAGVPIASGTTVTIFPLGANRDPRRFEEPDELRLDRRNSRENLAFGRGIHACPGGSLARATLDGSSARVNLTMAHTFTEPGTYFPAVRVTAQRRGDLSTTHGRVQDLGRVRVVVG